MNHKMDNIFTLFPDNERSTSTSISGQKRTSVLKPQTPDVMLRDALKPGTSNNRPKGLSMRPKSDVNVVTSTSSTNKKNYPNIENSSVKHGKVTKPSPKKDNVLPKKNEPATSTRTRELLANIVLHDVLSNESRQSNETVFVRPQTPRKVVKTPELPEPEEMAHYCCLYDDDYNIYDAYINNMYKAYIEAEAELWGGDNNSVMEHYNDEGFESATDEILVPDIPEIIFDDVADQDAMQDDFDLPEIPEDEGLF